MCVCVPEGEVIRFVHAYVCVLYVCVWGGGGCNLVTEHRWSWENQGDCECLGVPLQFRSPSGV